MADLGWRRRRGSSRAARRGARQRAGLTPASASNTLSCQRETLHSQQLKSIKKSIDSDHGIYRFGRARLRARRYEYVNGLPAVLRLRKHIAERDVGQVIAVGIDVEAIDCVGMKCVRVGICIEDDHGAVDRPRV